MKELGVLGTYISFAMTMMIEMQENQKRHKEKILAEWEESKNMPRKMKKRVRKRLNIEWAIASYDPFV